MTAQGHAPDEQRSAPGLLTRFFRLAIIPIVAVLGGLVVGGIILVLSSALTGEIEPFLPFVTYANMFRGAFGSTRGITFTIVAAAPLILGGMAVGLGFKAGLFNIGAQGQYLLGAVGSAAVAASVASASPILAIPAAILGGALAGAAWGFIPGALKAWTGAHEVVTTIMLNVIASILVVYLITGPLEAPGFSFSRTGPVGNAALPGLFGTGIQSGVLIAFAFVPVVWWLLWRSTLGFEIRTVGANPDAARYAGMRPAFLTILTMSLCGLLAGLAGAIQILGVIGFMTSSIGSAIGFTSITVALLGRAHPVGIMLAALLFGAMRAGAGLMQIGEGNIETEIIDVIQATILLFLAADVVIKKALRIRAPDAEPTELQTVTKTYGSGAPT